MKNKDTNPIDPLTFLEGYYVQLLGYIILKKIIIYNCIHPLHLTNILLTFKDENILNR